MNPGWNVKQLNSRTRTPILVLSTFDRLRVLTCTCREGCHRITPSTKLNRRRNDRGMYVCTEARPAVPRRRLRTNSTAPGQSGACGRVARQRRDARAPSAFRTTAQMSAGCQEARNEVLWVCDAAVRASCRSALLFGTLVLDRVSLPPDVALECQLAARTSDRKGRCV
ncbi:hypothetical protein BDW22DRAFT_1266586 [Trametopsis cervina]|nr:hypothetical protein BDW22DRAFT_1266586 [Trametopsis cervina]